jgi:hypothetical protein
MYLGIDVHKRYAQVAAMDEGGEIVEEVRVEGGPQWPVGASVSDSYRRTATAPPEDIGRLPAGRTADYKTA